MGNELVKQIEHKFVFSKALLGMVNLELSGSLGNLSSSVSLSFHLDSLVVKAIGETILQLCTPPFLSFPFVNNGFEQTVHYFDYS